MAGVLVGSPCRVMGCGGRAVTLRAVHVGTRFPSISLPTTIELCTIHDSQFGSLGAGLPAR